VGSRPKLCSPITVTHHSPVSNKMPKTYTPRSRSPGAPRIMNKTKRSASVHPDEAPRSRESTASCSRDDSNVGSTGGESTVYNTLNSSSSRLHATRRPRHVISCFFVSQLSECNVQYYRLRVAKRVREEGTVVRPLALSLMLMPVCDNTTIVAFFHLTTP
jgi:hypothetical protein